MIETKRYIAMFEEVAVTAKQDLFEIINTPSVRSKLISLSITQSSDAGDTEAEMASVLIHRSTSPGSGGALITPSPLNHDQAFSGQVYTNNTTQGGEGTKVWANSFNIMNGLEKYFEPEERIVIPVAGHLVVELQANPTDSLTMSGYIVFEELALVHTKDPS